VLVVVVLGLYTLVFRVSSADKRVVNVDAAHRRVKVTTPIEPKDAVLTLRDLDEQVDAQVRKFRCVALCVLSV